jgi:hypothetical protein
MDSKDPDGEHNWSGVYDESGTLRQEINRTGTTRDPQTSRMSWFYERARASFSGTPVFRPRCAATLSPRKIM